MMNILIVNGPNLDLLGTREPELYGDLTLADMMELVRARAVQLGAEIEVFQSNDEGALVTRIGHARESAHGLVINPAAYTHTSIAIRDAIKASGLPCVEVHLTNTHAREEFRRTSVTAPVCLAQVMGFGAAGYVLALEGLVAHVKGLALS